MTRDPSSDVLLVEPPNDRRLDNRPGFGMPLGVGYVAAWIRRRGIGCVLDDLNRLDAGPAWLARRVRALRPRVIGISCSPWNEGAWPALFAAARAAAPESVLVAGGLSVRYDAAAFLRRFPALDAAAEGEGEPTFEALARAALAADGRRDALRRIAGVAGLAVRRGRAVAAAPARPPVMDADAFPSPIVEGVFRPRDYPGIAKLIAARGCPFRCAYCQWGSPRLPYRVRSVGRVVEELRALHRDGVREIAFGDGTFNLSTRRLRAFRDAFRREGFAFRLYDVDCRARYFDGVQARLLRDMGAVDVGFGLETIHPRTQALIRKRQDPRDVARAARCARRRGLRVHVSVMIGLPGETEDDIARTLDFLEDLAPDFAGIFPVRCQAGTEFAASPGRYPPALPPRRVREIADRARRRFRTVGADPRLYERRRILAETVFPHAGDPSAAFSTRKEAFR